MKSILNVVFFVAAASVSNAAVVIGSNEIGGDEIVAGQTRAVFDTQGVPLRGGYVGIGFFSSMPDFSASTGVEVSEAFVQLGSAGSFNFNLGANAIPGIFSHSASAPITGSTNSTFIGKNMFLVIGNGDSLATSTEVFVLDSGRQFAQDNPLFNATIDLSAGVEGEVLVGTVGFEGGRLVIDAGDFGTSPESIQLGVLIPEPSTALLGALGALGLLRRRRN